MECSIGEHDINPRLANEPGQHIHKQTAHGATSRQCPFTIKDGDHLRQRNSGFGAKLIHARRMQLSAS
jgi:hypothetical protein